MRQEGITIMSRRLPILCLLAILLYAAPAYAGQSASPQIEVWKSASCGCCIKWVEHLQKNGFNVTANNVAYGMLAQIKRQAGIPEEQSSCHTAKVGGYVIEGHVPAADVKRLLDEKPEAVGLAVPGMPVGSPGMEQGDEKEPYEVLLVKKDGSTEVFSRHGQ